MGTYWSVLVHSDVVVETVEVPVGATLFQAARSGFGAEGGVAIEDDVVEVEASRPETGAECRAAETRREDRDLGGAQRLGCEESLG